MLQSLSERSMAVLFQPRIFLQYPVGEFGGLCYQSRVTIYIRDMEGQFTALPDPEEFPGAALLQVLLCYLEAAVGILHDSEPVSCLLRIRGTDEHAIGLILTTAHSAPQLMELCQAEALCILYHHHRRIRNIYTNLYDCGGHKDIRPSRSEILHYAILLPGRKLAMQNLKPYSLCIIRPPSRLLLICLRMD